MGFAFAPEEILELSIKIEEMGNLYYEGFIKKTKDKNISEIFQYLAEQEKQHLATFKKIYEEFKGGDIFGDYDKEEVSSYFNALVESRLFINPDSVMALINQTKSADEVIMQAIRFEKDTILYFHELGELLKDEYKKIVHRLINEEKSHIIKLFQLRKEINKIK